MSVRPAEAAAQASEARALFASMFDDSQSKRSTSADF